MSAAGPPQSARPLGGAARSAVRGDHSAAGPSQSARPLGGAARSAVRGDHASARRTAAAPDPESRLSEAHHESLRLWLRLLTCTMLIEQRVRTRLRERFAISLPRFDLMAQLERNPHGLRMGELSRRLMVTGGNVTGITDQLVAEGLVERRAIAGDRRAYAVRLTAKGKRTFDTMAAAHEQWVIGMLADVPVRERDRLHALLGRVKQSVQAHDPSTSFPETPT